MDSNKRELRKVAETEETQSSYVGVEQEETTDSCEEGYSRFNAAKLRDNHMYPTGKPGHTTKTHRYNPATKKSDEGKIHGKLKGGRSRNRIKQDGFTPTANEALKNSTL